MTNVLFVGAQGRTRSATAMHLMNRLYGYNTRCCGVEDGSLVPLNDQLLDWAEEVVVVDSIVEDRVLDLLNITGIRKKVKCLNIPDEYDYMQEELCSLIQRRYFSV